MLSIGRKGVFTVAPPYLLPAVEYEVIAIQSLNAMAVLGLDPYKLVYEPYGFTRDHYKNVPLTTQTYLLRSTVGTVYIPVDAILHTDTASYVNYVEKAIVLQVGAHPSSAAFTNTVSELFALIEDTLGVKPVIETRTVSTPQQVPMEQHLSIQAARRDAISAARPVNEVSIRELEITSLKTRLKTLELFLLQYSKTCADKACHQCVETTASYPASTVFYQYSLADYYVQVSRGDVHDLPINNAFVRRLHDTFSPGQQII